MAEVHPGTGRQMVFDAAEHFLEDGDVVVGVVWNMKVHVVREDGAFALIGGGDMMRRVLIRPDWDEDLADYALRWGYADEDGS